MFEKPYCVVVEAKQDDFEGRWSQCLAEMIAVQKINQIPEQVVYGMVSNGKLWEFARLHELTFIRSPRTYLLSDLKPLFGALHYIFEQCKTFVESPAALLSS